MWPLALSPRGHKCDSSKLFVKLHRRIRNRGIPIIQYRNLGVVYKPTLEPVRACIGGIITYSLRCSLEAWTWITGICTATGCFLRPYGDSYHISRHVKPVKGLLRSRMTNDMERKAGFKNQSKIKCKKLNIIESRVLSARTYVPQRPKRYTFDQFPGALTLAASLPADQAKRLPKWSPSSDWTAPTVIMP